MSEAISNPSDSNAVTEAASTRRNWKTIIADAKLPPMLTTTLTSVIQGTRLWRREKSAIAMELVAHFQDGVESGQSADDLQKSFGNAKQAAKLIRRAKIRCRPFWWQAWWYVSRSLAVVIGVYLVAAVWQTFGRASVSTDYTALINQKAESWPENEKAWPIYREAFREFDFVNMPTWYENSDYNFTPSSENWPEIKKWLDTKQHAIAIMRKGSQLPGLGFSVYRRDSSYDPADQLVLGELNARNPEKVGKERVAESFKEYSTLEILIPHVSTIRRAIDFIRADALRAASQKDGTTAIEDIKVILAISKQVEELPLGVNELNACRFQNYAMQTICDIVAEYPEGWDDEQLKLLAHLVAGLKLHPEKGLLEGERMMMRDLVQRLFTDDGNGDGRITREGIQSMRALIPRTNANKGINLFFVIPNCEDIVGNSWADKALENPLFQTLILPATNSVSASRKEVLQRFDQWIAFQLPFLTDSRWVIQSEDPVWLREMRSEPWQQKKYWLVNLMTSFGYNYRHGVQRAQGYKEGALIGLALELHKRKNGSYPQSLDELAPKYLPSVPLDRFSGKPLIYKLKEGKPVVYSVGADGDDDGGSIAKEEKDGWIEYTYRNHRQMGEEDSEDKTQIKYFDGDWVIWTGLPEHRVQKKQDKADK